MPAALPTKILSIGENAIDIRNGLSKRKLKQKYGTQNN
jgi:hypothetical protein